MLEIVVQVLPSIVKRKSGSIDFKEEFAQNLKKSIKKFRKSKILIKNYKKQEDDNEKVDDQKKKVQNTQDSYTQQVDLVLENLDSQKFFTNYSITDKLDSKDQKIFLNQIPYCVGKLTDFVLVALKQKQYTVYEFYDSFICYYHDQQISKLRQLGKIVNIEGFQDDVFTFSQSLALDFTINQLTQISYKQKGKLKFNFQGQSTQNSLAWEEKYFNAQDENQEYLKLIRSCVLLSVKGTSFSFVHKSIQEFLVAKYIVDLISQITFQKNQKQISQDDQNYLKQSLFNSNSFNISQQNYSGIVEILKEQLDVLKFVDNKLLSIVELSKNKDFIRAASNSIHIMSARQVFLGGKDLQDLEINDTNLNALSFFGSNFENSKFSNVCVDSCNFNFCNLANTQWNNIICSEKPYLEGHNNKVLVAEFSNDGKLLASGDCNCKIIIWDVIFYKLITKFKHQLGSVETLSIKFVKNNQQLITGGGIYIKIWSLNLPEYSLQKTLFHHYQNIIQILVSSNQQRFYSCDSSGYVIFWNLDDILQNDNFNFHIQYPINFRIIEIEEVFERIKQKKQRKEEQKIEKRESMANYIQDEMTYFEEQIQQINEIEKKKVKEHESFIGKNGEEIDYILDIALSQNENILFAIQKERICSYDILAKKCINQISINMNSKISQLSLSKDDNYLAVIFDQNFLLIFDVSFKTKFKLIYTESLIQKIISFSFSPDSKFFSSLGDDMILHRNIIQNELEQDNIIQNYELIVFSNFDDLYVVIQQNTIFLIDLITNQTISSFFHEKKAISAFFSKSPRNLIFGNDDNSISIWELYTLIKISDIQNAWDKYYQLSISDDSRLSVNIQDHHFIVINLEKFKEFEYIDCYDCYQDFQIIFQPKGFKIAIAKQSDLQIKDLQNQDNDNKEKKFNSDISCMNFSFSGQYLLLGFKNGAIKIFNDAKTQYQDFTKLKQPINSLVLSCDDLILCAQENNKIYIWNFETKVQISQGKFICDTVLIFIPINQILAYGVQQDVCFLNCQNLEQLKQYSHEKQVYDLTCSQDNKYLVSVDQGSSIILQNLVNSNKINRINLLKSENLFKTIFINPNTFLTATHYIIRIWQIVEDDNINLVMNYYREHILNIITDNDQNIMIHSKNSCEKIRIQDFYQEHIHQMKIKKYLGNYYPFAISKNWNMIAYCEQTKIYFIKLYGHQNEFELEDQDDVYMIQFSNNEKLFLSYNGVDNYKLWDLDLKQNIGSISFYQQNVKQIQFNEVNEYIFIQGDKLIIFDIKNLLEIKFFKSFNCEKHLIKNDLIALQCKDFCVMRKWNDNKTAQTHQQFLQKKITCDFTYSSNNYLGFIADQSLEIWSLKEQRLFKTIPNSEAFAFSQSEKLLAIQNDSIIRLINLENDEELSNTSRKFCNHNIIYFLNDQTIISTNLESIFQFNIYNNELILVRRMKEKLKYSFVQCSTQLKCFCFSNKFTNKIFFINIEKFQELNYIDNRQPDKKLNYALGGKGGYRGKQICKSMIISQDEKYLILEFEHEKLFFQLENQKQRKLILDQAHNLIFLNQNQILGEKDFQNEKSKLISFQIDDFFYQISAQQEFGQLQSKIKCKSYCQQHSYFAYGGIDHKIYLWDIKGRAELSVFSGHSSQINSVEFSPNGELIASAGDDKLVRLWNVNVIKNVKKEEGHNSQISCLAFSYDGLLLASGSEDCKIKIWSIKKKKYLKTLERHKTLVVKLEFSKDQNTLISYDRKCYIIVWDIKNLNDISFKIIKNLYLPIFDLVWDSNKQKISSLSNLKTFHNTLVIMNIWNYREAFEKNFEYTIKLPEKIETYEFIPNLQYQMACIINQKLMICNLKSNQIIKLKNDQVDLTQVTTSNDGTKLATFNQNYLLNLWELDNQYNWQRVRSINFKPFFGRDNAKTFKLKFSECGTKLYFLGEKQFSSFEIQNTHEEEETYRDFGLKEITCFSVEPDNQYIIFGHSQISQSTNDIQYLLSQFKIEKKQFTKISEFKKCKARIKIISFSFEKQFIAAGDESGQIYVWDKNTREIKSLQFFKNSENNLISLHQTFKENNKKQSFYANFMIWNIKEKQNYQFNILKEEKLTICQISQYCKYIAVQYHSDQKFRLFEINLQRNADVRDEIDAPFYLDVEFSPNEKFLFIREVALIFIRNIEKKENIWSKALDRFKAIYFHFGSFSANGQFLVIQFPIQNILLITLGEDYQIINSQNYKIQQKEKIIQLSMVGNELIFILTPDRALLSIQKQNFLILSRFSFQDSCNSDRILINKNNLYLQFYNKIDIYDIEKKILVDMIKFDFNQKFELFPDGSNFVITKGENFCFSKLDELKSYQNQTQFIGHQLEINQVIVSQNSALMATGCYDYFNFIKLWNIQDTNNPQCMILINGGYSCIFKFSFDSCLFSWSSNGKIKCISTENLQLINQIILDENILGIQQLQQKNGDQIFLFVTDTKLFSKDDINQQSKNNLIIFTNKLHTYAFSQISRAFAFSDIDGKIYQYQIEDQKCNLLQIHFQKCQTGLINCLCFSPNGKILLSGGQDGTIRVWDSQKEAQLFCLQYQSDSIKCLAFNPNNLYFAVGFSDGSIELYITNFFKGKLDKEQNLIKCLGINLQIGCLKIFAQQSLFSAYESNFENRIKHDKDEVGLAKLFSQKVGRVQKDISDIQEIQDIKDIQKIQDRQEIKDME